MSGAKGDHEHATPRQPALPRITPADLARRAHPAPGPRTVYTSSSPSLVHTSTNDLAESAPLPAVESQPVVSTVLPPTGSTDQPLSPITPPLSSAVQPATSLPPTPTPALFARKNPASISQIPPAQQTGEEPQPDSTNDSARLRPPGNFPRHVDPSQLRRAPGSAPGSGGLSPLPPSTPPTPHLPVSDETSAGGVVVRPPAAGEKGLQVAVITRRNRAGRLEWCLPKGHLEGEETAEEAAMREVFEETGIRGEIRCTLGVIDYWFSGDTRRVHKMVHHFLLVMTGGYLTVENDPDHEAEDAHWVPLSTLPDRLSYANEQKLAVVARGMVAENPALVADLLTPTPTSTPLPAPTPPLTPALASTPARSGSGR